MFQATLLYLESEVVLNCGYNFLYRSEPDSAGKYPDRVP